MSVVFTAPEVDCSSSEYRRLHAYAGIVLALFIAGVPLAIALLAFAYRQSPRNAHESTSTRSRKSSVAVATAAVQSQLFRFGLLFEPFHARFAFWQAWILVRRTALVVLSATLVLNAPIFSFLVSALPEECWTNCAVRRLASPALSSRSCTPWRSRGGSRSTMSW